MSLILVVMFNKINLSKCNVGVLGRQQNGTSANWGTTIDSRSAE